MADRLISIALSAHTLVQCYNLVEKIRHESGMDTAIGASESDVIEEALVNVLKRLSKSGKLPVYESEDEAERDLENYLPELKPLENTDELDDALNSLFGDQTDEGESIIFSETQSGDAQVDTQTEPPIEPEVKNRSDDERILDEHSKDVVLNKPPWEADNVKPFKQLEQLAPKDAFIEAAKQSNNEAQQRAIECIYSNIPMEVWGTETARKLIADMTPQIELYLNSQQGDLSVPESYENSEEENEDGSASTR